MRVTWLSKAMDDVEQVKRFSLRVRYRNVENVFQLWCRRRFPRRSRLVLIRRAAISQFAIGIPLRLCAPVLACVIIVCEQDVPDCEKGAQSRQCHILQERKVILFRKTLTDLASLPQKPTLGKEHHPLPVPLDVCRMQVRLEQLNRLFAVRFALKSETRI